MFGRRIVGGWCCVRHQRHPVACLLNITVIVVVVVFECPLISRVQTIKYCSHVKENGYLSRKELCCCFFRSTTLGCQEPQELISIDDVTSRRVIHVHVQYTCSNTEFQELVNMRTHSHLTCFVARHVTPS